MFPALQEDSQVCMWRRLHETMDAACQQDVLQGSGGSVQLQFKRVYHDSCDIHRSYCRAFASIYACHVSPSTHPDGVSLFQSGNTTIKCIQVTQNWFQNYLTYSQLLHWSSCSRDLNRMSVKCCRHQ